MAAPPRIRRSIRGPRTLQDAEQLLENLDDCLINSLGITDQDVAGLGQQFLQTRKELKNELMFHRSQLASTKAAHQGPIYWNHPIVEAMADAKSLIAHVCQPLGLI